MALFIAPSLALFLSPSLASDGEGTLLGWAVIERVLQLVVIGVVFRSAASLLAPPRFLKLNVRFFAIGLGLEALFAGAVLLTIVTPGMSSLLAAVGLFLIVRAVVSILLYPMPFMDPLLSSKEALAASKLLTAQVPLTALFLWPLAIFLIGSGLAFVTYPDGRLWWSAPVTQVIATACHLVFVFRAAAAAILVTGLRYQPDGRPRFGSPAVLVVSGLALWGANLVRAYSLPPGPSITVVSASINEERKIELILDANDSRFDFRGFTPQRFFLGGAQGYPITSGVGKPELLSKPEGSAAGISRRYRIVFSTERAPSDVVQIEDLNLWYGAAKVQQLGIELVQQSIAGP